MKAFDKAIDINPNYSLVWDGKGVALAKLNKLNEDVVKNYKEIFGGELFKILKDSHVLSPDYLPPKLIGRESEITEQGFSNHSIQKDILRMHYFWDSLG